MVEENSGTQDERNHSGITQALCAACRHYWDHASNYA